MATRIGDVYMLAPGDEKNLHTGWVIPTSGGMARVASNNGTHTRVSLIMVDGKNVVGRTYNVRDTSVQEGSGILSLNAQPININHTCPVSKRTYLESGGLGSI